MDFEGFLSGIDTIFYSKVSYAMWGNFQPEQNSGETEKSIWASVHSKTEYVFSSEPRQDSKAYLRT